jgi:hypothetical protein
LAADLQHRRYDAVITQDQLIIDVTLSPESRFRLGPGGDGNRFRGRVDAAGATFALEPFDAGYPSIVERLPDGTSLAAYGSAVTTRSIAGLSGTLNGDGAFAVWDSKFPARDSSWFTWCYGAHGFTLTRR